MGYRLCTIDLDGTLIQGTVFQALADGLGKGEEVRRLDARYAAGEMSLEENFWAELALFEGVPVAEAQEIVRRGPWVGNRDRAAEELRALGMHAGLLTDQPRFLAELAGPFDPLLCSQGGVEQGRIARSVQARFDKLANLRGWCREQGIEMQDVIHCGNGANDVPVFERVGLAIAVNAEDPEVARRADIAVGPMADLRQLSEVVAQVLRQG